MLHLLSIHAKTPSHELSGGIMMPTSLAADTSFAVRGDNANLTTGPDDTPEENQTTADVNKTEKTTHTAPLKNADEVDRPTKRVKLDGAAPLEQPKDAGTMQKEEQPTASKEKAQQTQDTEKLQQPSETDNNQASTQSKKPNKAFRYFPSQRNKSGPRAKNGSYRNYYSRRGNGIHGDDRIPIIRDECKLQGRRKLTILDVGCNNGTVIIEMASLDRCVEAVGVDIDPNLVGDARKKLREHITNETTESNISSTALRIQGRIPKPQDSFPLSLRRPLYLMKEAARKAQHHSKGVGNDNEMDMEHQSPKFPYNVTFRREDFAHIKPTRTSQEGGKYDIVLCLSVTKWVHLAGGDDALKRLFRRLHACLKPGGVLILEPQPLKSYKSAIRKGLGKKDFKGERKLKPHKFVEYLTKTIGFSKMKMLRDVRHRGQAFNRPIMAFYKKRLMQSLTSLAPTASSGIALSPDVAAFLGVVPSDEEEEEEVQQREEHDDAAQNTVEASNNAGNATEEGREGQEGREEEGEREKEEGKEEEGEGKGEIATENGDARRQDSSEPKNQGKEDPKDLELTPCTASARVSNVEGSSFILISDGKKGELSDEAVKVSSPRGMPEEEAILPFSDSKRKSTGQLVDGSKAQSPKRTKHDNNRERDQTSPPKDLE